MLNVYVPEYDADTLYRIYMNYSIDYLKREYECLSACMNILDDLDAGDEFSPLVYDLVWCMRLVVSDVLCSRVCEKDGE